jgi:hypothetical protein
VRQKNHGRKSVTEKLHQKKCGRKSIEKVWRKKCYRKITKEKVRQKNHNIKSAAEKSWKQHGWGLFMRDMTHLV